MQAVQATKKPSYLGLLNEISEAERRGAEYLTAWAEHCADPAVEEVVRLVAAREAEHSAAFARRVVELGYRVRPRPDNEEEVRRKEAARSDLDEVATFRALGYRPGPDVGGPDIFDGFFADHSLDPETGGLLGRYIAEERDSARRLQEAFDSLLERQEATRT